MFMGAYGKKNTLRRVVIFPLVNFFSKWWKIVFLGCLIVKIWKINLNFLFFNNRKILYLVLVGIQKYRRMLKLFYVHIFS
jgi:hypothetical protein